LPYEKHLLIVPSRPGEVQEVVTHLMRVGLDQVGGYLEDGMDAWENQGFDVGQLESWSVQKLEQELRRPENQRPFVLDVRTESEWNGGHIEGAHHIHGGLLQEQFEKIPKDRPVAVICGTGYRGSIAASFLKSHGYCDVASVLGGMMAWKAAGCGSLVQPV